MELQLQSWFTVVLGLITVGIVFFLRHLRRNDDYWKKRGVPYQPRPSIYDVMTMFTSKPLHQVVNESYKKYGRVFGRFEIAKPSLTVAEPELLRDIFVKDFHVFSTRRDFTMADPVMSKMLTVLTGEDWKRVRTVITPAFTSKKMRKMTSIINSCVETILANCKEHINKGMPIDCRRIFGAFTMDVIASSAFATKIDSHNDPNNPFVVHARKAFTNQAFYRMLAPLILPSFVLKRIGFKPGNNQVMTFFQSATLQVIEERRKKGQRGDDFLQLMIDASNEVIEGEEKKVGFKSLDLDDEEDHYGRIDGNSNISYTTKKLSHNEIVAQCVIFFLVGYETTASTLSFTAYNLATNPECQEKLRREVDEAFEKNAEMSYDVVRDMKYLDAVVSETLRLYSPLIFAERTATEDYELGSTGITIPKGMVVQIPIYAMHHDPEFFPEPEKFDPERFMSSNHQNHPPYAYLPFGAGPRNCIAMRFALLEIKLCLSALLRQYSLRPAPETKIPLEFTLSKLLLTTKDMPLLVEKRTDLGAI